MSNEENAAEAGAQAPDGALDRYGNPTDHPAFNQFVATISALRAPDGCPWDREQTHASISHNMIEEAYEAVCAIEEEDTSHLREELGDVLLQVVLQSQIAADEGEFSIDDVCADVNAKMVRRHPHVFGSVEASNASEVLDVWDQVKLAERQAAGDADGTGASKPEGLLDGVPRTFPALMEAQKISRKAAAVGFEWDSIEDVWGKVAEEKAELIEAYASAPHAANGKIDTSVAGEYDLDEEQAARLAEATEMEFGDVLFALVNVGRRMGIDAESALRASNAKFRARWAAMEEIASQQGKRMQDFSTSEQNKLWGEVKGK
ncbi:nucleoside triphosphate pyrophosphohydrolase [uncultured Ellagibacter sp.]|uniref:nucleoside triphosphate pyrophosphohydrolase n=1 Tax=uncultured Ellagibacter sp. TaxID=2137580 RepID=UPI0026061452|nr:nucleoside triphosphate pyrophosphohydrolase [uncultured Ellagibacter sp.]